MGPPGCLHLMLLLLLLSPLYSDGEVAEVCAEEKLKLNCEHMDESTGGSGEGSNSTTSTSTSTSTSSYQIVISEAWLYGSTSTIREVDEFLGNRAPARCRVPKYNQEYKTGSILQYINKECGGQVSCTFGLETHVPLDHQTSPVWKKGALWVRYHCIRQTAFHRVCGTDVRAQEGWLKSVGYPQYYIGEPPVCTLTVSADEGQHIELTITDLSIREIQQPKENKCKDSIVVSEGSKTMLRRCGDTNKPLTVTSKGSSLNLTLSASSHVFPKRGYVAHYKALGCPTPQIPEDAHLTFRNTTHAEVWCCARHVFSDTFTRKKVLECVKQNTWSEELPDCIDLDDLLSAGNITMDMYLSLVNGTSGLAMAEKLRQAHFVYDLVLPTVIMSVLVLGNVAVVLLIIYCRRRN